VSAPRFFPSAYPAPLLDVEMAIRNLTQDLSLAFNTGNYDQAAALFSADGTLMPPHHEIVQGQKSVERKLVEFADAGYQDLRLETLRVENSGDVVVEIGRYTVTVRCADGSHRTDRGKFLATWRRLGAWRLLATSWSSNLPTSAGQVAA
jgi:uncharacterized protein (TIGR02246 family)